jgi:hypothetical protein
MSQPKPITAQELEVIRESVRRAWGKVAPEPKVIRDWRKMVKGESKLDPVTRLQNRMLFSLRCNKSRDLGAWPIPSVIRKALAKNDLKFFVRLGRVLAIPPVTLTPKDYEGQSASRLSTFMLEHWSERRDGLPELFYLTPDGLAKVCSYCLRLNLSFAAVVKLRQRLGLKPFKRQKVDVDLTEGKLRFR